MVDMETNCQNCRSTMSCDPKGHCWCADFPHGPMPVGATGCFCPTCLDKHLKSLKVSIGPSSCDLANTGAKATFEVCERPSAKV
jgi:hypothetical protein